MQSRNRRLRSFRKRVHATTRGRENDFDLDSRYALWPGLGPVIYFMLYCPFKMYITIIMYTYIDNLYDGQDRVYYRTDNDIINGVDARVRYSSMVRFVCIKGLNLIKMIR